MLADIAPFAFLCAGNVLMLVALVIQEIRIGKCETACRATAMRVTRMANASETAQNAHSGEIITKTNNHR